MTHDSVWSPSPAETERIGEIIGGLAQPGEVVLLRGPLGAGKTTLTRGIARGLGVRGVVSSPTFTLIAEHQGRLPLYHIDLYRLDRPADLLTLGLEDYLAAEGVAVVEWPERATGWLPEDRLDVTLDLAGEEGRWLHFHPRGPRATRLVQDLLARLE